MQDYLQKTLSQIKEMILKHKDYLDENPDILGDIQDRLSKAIDNDAEKWLQENDPNFKDDDSISTDEADSLYDGYSEDDGFGGAGDEMFDSPAEPEADEDVAYASKAPVEFEDIDSDGPAKEAVSEPAKTPGDKSRKVSASGYQDWAPHGEYTPEQDAAMKQLQEKGYSHREAERLANAHRSPETFQDALTHRVRPSEMSSTMMGELKELTGEWLDNARKVSYERAEADKNPVKYAKGQTLKVHESAMGDYSKELKEWQGSDEVKDMSPREKHKASREWKRQYHEQNPEHRANLTATASKGGEVHTEAAESRKQHLDERLQGILTAGMGTGDMSSQEAAQHVGGVKTDAGYSASTVKDPAASFAEANPEYVQSLRDKLSQHLPEEAQSRLKNVDNAAKHLGVTRKPKMKGDNNGSK